MERIRVQYRSMLAQWSFLGESIFLMSKQSSIVTLAWIAAAREENLLERFQHQFQDASAGI